MFEGAAALGEVGVVCDRRAGAGGAGYWTWGVSSGELDTLQNDKEDLEKTARHSDTKDPDSYFEAALGKQRDIDEKQTIQNITLATTIVTGVIGLTGIGMGLFWNPFQEEEPATDESQEEQKE